MICVVDEAIAQLKEVSLEGFTSVQSFDMSLDLHYFVADSSGKTAHLEFPDGKLSVQISSANPAMTNNFFATSNAELTKYSGFGGTQAIPETVSFAQKTSLMRYVLVSDSIVRLQNSRQVAIDSGFMLLDRVAASSSPVTPGDTRGITTQWSVVYDMKNKVITYTSANNSHRGY